jgi:hypothetical protein
MAVMLAAVVLVAMVTIFVAVAASLLVIIFPCSWGSRFARSLLGSLAIAEVAALTTVAMVIFVAMVFRVVTVVIVVEVGGVVKVGIVVIVVTDVTAVTIVVIASPWSS